MYNISIREGLSFGWNGHLIWVSRVEGDRVWNAKKVVLEFEEADHKYMLPKEPTFRIPMRDSVNLFKTLGQELIESGILTDPQHVKGELTATKKHLEDMRDFAEKLLAKMDC